MRRTMPTALAALTLTAAGALAADGPRPGTLEILTTAVQRGYGGMCDLRGAVVQDEGSGYYRCLDVGPYRFTFEYGRVRGFVLVQGADPFPIMESKDGDADFLVSGPWTRDLDSRVEAWYADEVGGARARREASDADAKRADEASRAVDGYGRPAAPNPPPVPQYAQPQYVAPPYAPPQYAQPQYAQPQYVQPQYAPQQGGYGQAAPQQPYAQGGPAPQAPTYARPAPVTQGTGAAPDAYPLSAPQVEGDAASMSAPPGGRLIAPGVVQYGRGNPPPPGQ